MGPLALVSPARRLALPAAILIAGAVVPLALASTPPIKGGRYKGHDATKGTVALAVTSTGRNFSSGRFNLVLLGQAGRGSCVGPAHVTLQPTRVPQITPRGTFRLSGAFPFREPSPDPQAFRGTGRSIVQGAFSDGGKRVSGTVQLTAVGKGITCRSGIVHFTAAAV
ncbi:MAG: hypothetical protein ACRDM1_01965 [Gaiellaceae bacterium]